jgi:hypothetical protein
VRLALPADLGLRSTVFSHRYDQLSFPTFYLVPDDCEMVRGFDRDTLLRPKVCTTFYPVQASSYGLEALLERRSGAVRGWISYTYSHADSTYSGMPRRPPWDVRHIANAVIQIRLGGGWEAQVVGHVRTGTVLFGQDLPGTHRLDLGLSYSWHPSWGTLRAYVDWFNTTLQRDAAGVICDEDECRIDYAAPFYAPHAGLRATF